MRTVEEILAYYQQEESTDFMGHMAQELIPYLPYEMARPYLVDEAVSEWEQTPLTRDAIIAEMKDYMEFAWGKVEDHRGLSAIRSVEKMQAWLWLLGDEETLAYAKADNHYTNYGAPILKKICEVYGFPIPEESSIANMAQGKPCCDDCEMGCGRALRSIVI